MISKSFAIAVRVDVNKLNPFSPFLTAGGRMEESMGVTDFLSFTLNHDKINEKRCIIRASVVDTNVGG